MNIFNRLAHTFFVSTCASLCIVVTVHASDPAFSVDARITSTTVSSKNSNGLTARYATSFDVPIKYRNQFPRNSARYVQVPEFRVINGAKAAKKGSPLNLAVLGIVVGMGWVIDELTGQISIPGTSTIDPEYNPNRAYAVFGESGGGYSIANACRAASGGPYDHHSIEPNGMHRCRLANGTTYAIVIQVSTNPYPPEYISTDPVPLTQQQLINDFWPELQNLPGHILADALAPNGNPLNTPEIEADLSQLYAEIAANNPNLNYDPATNTFTYNDPDTGESTSTQPNAEPELNPNDLPDDYARENTLTDAVSILQSLKDLFVNSEGLPEELVPEDYEYKGSTFDTMLTDMTLVPDPPSLNFMPNLPQYSSTCQQLTLSYKGHTVQFPDANQCSKLGTAKTIIAYMLYVLTAFGIAQVVLTPRGTT